MKITATIAADSQETDVKTLMKMPKLKKKELYKQLTDGANKMSQDGHAFVRDIVEDMERDYKPKTAYDQREYLLDFMEDAEAINGFEPADAMSFLKNLKLTGPEKQRLVSNLKGRAKKLVSKL